MNDKSLARAIDLAQRAAAALLDTAPLRSDETTRRLASAPGAKFFATTITPDSIAITLVSGDEMIEVFRYSPSAPSTFPTEAA
jgi:hypothetical protein